MKLRAFAKAVCFMCKCIGLCSGHGSRIIHDEPFYDSKELIVSVLQYVQQYDFRCRLSREQDYGNS